jgi:PAS domain S-box-containing protein
MNWVTVIWSIGGGACLTLALMHFIIWWNDRTAKASLVFSVMAAGVAAFAACELALMLAQTPEAYGAIMRWGHLPAWIIVVSLVAFVRLYLRAGRLWLAWTIVGLRTFCLLLNFIFSPNLNFWAITGLKHIRFLGDTVSLGEGVPNPWMLLAQLSLLLVVIFVADATLAVWRRGERRQAVVVGGSILFFCLASTVDAVVILWGLVQMPLTVSLFYQGIVAAMAYELSYDVLRAAQIARRLQASEAELRETHERMDLAANAAELGIWLWDIARNHIWISDKGRALFGFAPSEKLDIHRFRNAIHPEDRESLREAVQNCINTGGEYEDEHRILLPNGQARWLAHRGQVEFTADGTAARMRGISFDITSRKLTEEALRESESRFRIVADAAPVLIWMSGMDKLCTFFNKTWLEFTGRSLDQEMGNGWAEGVHPDDLQSCLKIYTEAFEARQPFVMQYRLRRNDGEYRWISDHGVPRYGAQGNFTGYIGSCVDVTELINKERALREFEERVVLAAQAAHLGVWEMDTTTNELWMSDGARTLFQFDSETRLGHATVQDRVHPEDRALRDSAVKRAIETQSGYEIEYRVLLPDGTLRWIGSRGRCVTGENGTGARLIGVSIDITPRKIAEAEALRHREELGHLSRVAVMGELTASIAHELNQPLSGITSNASAGQRFIDRGDVDLRELRDLLGDIMADGRRAGDVIRGIQSMVKKGAPARQPVNLNDLVINVVRIVNPNAMLQSCQLETLLESNLPALEADPIQLQQVLLNLVINAFDAMHDTAVPRRKVLIATERNGSDTIRTSVRDYGVGISEEARERLFEQFFTTKAKGLGMGLAIVRSIVESHGGTIVAENADGGGARFHFTLPAKPEPLA